MGMGLKWYGIGTILQWNGSLCSFLGGSGELRCWSRQGSFLLPWVHPVEGPPDSILQSHTQPSHHHSTAACSEYSIQEYTGVNKPAVLGWACQVVWCTSGHPERVKQLPLTHTHTQLAHTDCESQYTGADCSLSWSHSQATLSPFHMAWEWDTVTQFYTLDHSYSSPSCYTQHKLLPWAMTSSDLHWPS